MIDFRAATLRVGPAYTLILRGDLTLKLREALSLALEDRAVAGVLVPADGGRRTVKAVDATTVLLWEALRRPRAVPSDLWDRLGEGAAIALARLVADDVLERDAGDWISGPAAALDGPATVVTDGLAAAALRYAAALDVAAADDLAWRLYAYHRLPQGPRSARRFPGSADVERALGIAPGGPARRRLEARGSFHATRYAPEDWLLWLAHDDPDTAATRPKIYVSPLPVAFPEAFARVVDVALAHGAPRLKVARTPPGVLRPDKLVLYPSGREEAAVLGAALASALADLPAHGVPFTAALHPDRLVSWGEDPPPSEAWRGPESGRLRTCRLLASALQHARARGEAPGGAIAQALSRVRLEGIDPATWEPR
jgi:hypothetical protein